MKKDATVLSILVEVLTDNSHSKKLEYEEELGVIIESFRKNPKTIGNLEKSNETSDYLKK
jgi:hypothetical protein